MQALHPRIPATSLRHRRDPRAAPALPAQCTFPRSPDARCARGDSRRQFRSVESRLDRALPLTIDCRMTNLLLALQAPATRSGNSNFLIIEFVLILGIIYFLMIRPQQKQRKQHESTIMALKKGDEIVTVGGIIARVVHIKEGVKDGAPAPTLGDSVTIQSGESRLVVERGRIARIGSSATGAPPA